MIRRLTARSLQNTFDIKLRQASNGEEALAIIHREPIDLIITDYFMPKMDGRELIVSLSTMRRPLPVIGITAASIGDEREELVAAGAVAALNKPMDIEQLMKIIVDVFTQQPRKSPFQ